MDNTHEGSAESSADSISEYLDIDETLEELMRQFGVEIDVTTLLRAAIVVLFQALNKEELLAILGEIAHEARLSSSLAKEDSDLPALLKPFPPREEV